MYLTADTNHFPISAAGIWSTLGDLQRLIFSASLQSVKEADSVTNGSAVRT
jgi:hypothetical protein